MITCALTGKPVKESEAMPCSALRPSLFGYIQRLHPGISEEAWLSREALADLSAGYVEDSLQSEMGEITVLERQVIDSIREHELLAAKPDDGESLARRTFGEKLSDGLASFGGSWRFIIFFGLFLLLWIAANTLLWRSQTAPDPFPFIFLNLILSCLAALQAPLIMMSQNRQETRDRERARLDYKINLKAELEIRHLHEKMDHLLRQHSERLLEIQRIQVDMLRELMNRKG